MKQTLTQAIILFIAFITTVSLQAQVTIGSDDAPLPGALLDLKSENDGTSSKGLAMPKVILTDKSKLFPMFDGVNGTNYTRGSDNYDKDTEDLGHIGLIVYHKDKCTLDGKGLYVWTGIEWNKIGDQTPGGLNFNQDYFDLPSGKDARALTAQNLTVSWVGGFAPTWVSAASGGLTAIPFTGTPLAPITLTNSPETISLLPDAMTSAEITTNPWRSKQTDLTFTYTECGQTKTVRLNQTNYALKVNNSFTNSQLIYSTTATGTIPVQGNATWKTTVTGTTGVATITPVTGGTDLKNNTSSTTSISYNASAGNRYDVTDITFSDTQTDKRFKDITFSILSCNASQNDLTLEQWAQRAGFTAADIASVAAGGTHPTTMANGIQLHKDQNGNIFLSGDFGNTAGRWMLNNLAATSYAKPHSQGRTLTLGHFFAYNIAYYYYPDANATLFNNNKRIGLLYNWDAATGGKGGSNGQLSLNDGENMTISPPQIQGICPNGWHLPSDYEWTQLEQEINTNTSIYSKLPDANATITIGVLGHRGSTHGQAMKDPCTTPTKGLPSNGASNIISSISTVRPGMNLLLLGALTSPPNYGYGASNYLWTASGSSITGQQYAWLRLLNSIDGDVLRSSTDRKFLSSVRCKKD